ncbi:bifunctional DNA primase/polymerase [Allostreptomyces psammosilenae]|uniref:DNA primase/polymerase bifunctional N-terminal domain-containing protein n=1 Tax=Allostreptomyces psammosilenae TaxID=1892865 RepID=A0A852ZT39_9ACTN|nr:bifunctional DNA primase/polymerase [Allostreptomyces psammosilenae]NYI05499.1 hypothetical protein [Allostreptomyces psammosilenae]
MREILSGRLGLASPQRETALTCALSWRWAVVPGAGIHRGGGRLSRGAFGSSALGGSRDARDTRDARGSREFRGLGALLGGHRRESARARRAAGPLCRCGRPDCAVPGAHALDPQLAAATRDGRMVRWWWSRRPDAPVVVPTGDRVSAVALPALAGARALVRFDRAGVRTGPVIAAHGRHLFLVAPYTFDDLGEILDEQEWVPTTLRYHARGGYLELPVLHGLTEPSAGRSTRLSRQARSVDVPRQPLPGRGARWVRPPVPAGHSAAGRSSLVPLSYGPPWLPVIRDLADVLIEETRRIPADSRMPG